MKTKLPTLAKMKLENNFIKKICCLLVLFSGMAFGQIVNIPDPIFKSYLLNSTHPTIDLNGDHEIDYSEAASYTNLFLIDNMGINDLTGVEAFIHLTELHCGSNNLTSLNVSGLTNLNSLFCGSNQLTNLNVSGDYNLITLDCYYNQLTTLDVSGLSNLNELYCNNNNLNSINLTGATNVNDFMCYDNHLTALDVSQTPNLIYLNCGNNQITSLNVANLINLQYFGIYNNLLMTIDISNCTSIINFSVNLNPLLSSIYMKNGRNEGVNLNDLPNLQFICADDSQIANLILQYPNFSLITNSYCSFTPGGNYNTITGSMIFDANNNGCDAADLPQPNIRVNINDGTSTGATFTTNTGNYTFYTQVGSFDLTPDTENPTWFTFSPTTATIPFLNNNNNTTTQNFCIVANGVHNDIEVVIEPILIARPGFEATYKIVYKNKGNQTLSGDIGFTYDDSVLDFVSATLAPTSQSTGLLNWSYTNMLPFENRSFYITLHVNAPTDTPPVNIGDSLSFNAFITPVISDENPLDNTFAFNQTVVGSFDPNNISCLEGAVVSPSLIGSYLHYGVNFENTGTSQAQNIVVKVVIDTTKYDVNSLQMLNTSNPAYIKITGNVVEFIFQNIMLDTGGHGDVLFKIKTLNSLNAGDMVTKNADIFFDYNAPINTGMANTTFELLNNGQFTIDNSIVVSPNPTASNVTINGNNNIKSVQVYDVQGRLLETKLVDDLKATVNLSEKTNGIYFLKITSDSGSKVEKIVKE